MKSLSLARPLVLIMIGVPGAGKSFFARQFAETFSAPLVSLDQLRTTIVSSPTHNTQENSLVTAVMKQQTTELLKTQKTFIVDGGMDSRAERLTLERSASAAGYDSLLIWVQTDEPTSKFRATHRSEKRKYDAYNSPLTDAQFSAISKRLTPPSPQEAYVVISGKHTYPTQAKIILKKLVAPRTEAAIRTPIASPPNHHHEPPTPQRRSISIN